MLCNIKHMFHNFNLKILKFYEVSQVIPFDAIWFKILYAPGTPYVVRESEKEKKSASKINIKISMKKFHFYLLFFAFYFFFLDSIRLKGVSFYGMAGNKSSLPTQKKALGPRSNWISNYFYKKRKTSIQ